MDWDTKIKESHALIDAGIERFCAGKEVVATVVLFSGGNDSTVLAHIFRDRATHFAHCNTTIGIESTRQFVRDTSALWGKPLIERLPTHQRDHYRDLVLEAGFPGPGQHWKMFQRLKQRALQTIRTDLIDGQIRTRRVVFLAGRRRDESARRADIPEMDRRGNAVFISPLVHWTNDDMRQYRKDFNLPQCEASQHIHMSGECLCGAFATANELDEIEFWFPDMFRHIKELEREVRDAGHPEPVCQWGWGNQPGTQTQYNLARNQGLLLCSSCEARYRPPEHVVPITMTNGQVMYVHRPIDETNT